MKLVKALVLLKMARSGAEANRLVKQGSVLVGNCQPNCGMRQTGPNVPNCICHFETETVAKVLGISKSLMVKGIDDFVLWRCKVKHGTCTCGGWHKATNPTEEVFWPTTLRVKDGSWRLLAREDGRNGFDQLPGCGIVPSQINLDVKVKGAFVDEIQLKFWKTVFAVRDFFKGSK